MVYDHTVDGLGGYYDSSRQEPEKSYAIYDGCSDETHYSLFTDDGHGNGNYICGSSDIYWIRRIAYSLDSIPASYFDYNGNLIG